MITYLLFIILVYYIFFLFACILPNSRSPRALSPTETSRDNIETTFDLDGNVETVSTASGARDDNRSLGSSSENR